MQVPHIQPVVVAARGKILIVRRPLQATHLHQEQNQHQLSMNNKMPTTHLLSMADQLSFGNDARRSDISLKNDTVSAARRQHLSIPRQGTDTG